MKDHATLDGCRKVQVVEIKGVIGPCNGIHVLPKCFTEHDRGFAGQLRWQNVDRHDQYALSLESHRRFPAERIIDKYWVPDLCPLVGTFNRSVHITGNIANNCQLGIFL